MALLNYSTTVAAARTVTEIQTILARAGARQILTEYAGSGTPTAVAFAIPAPDDQLARYRLPVDVAAVEKVLHRQRVAPRYRGAAQAERVAWRILKDWIEAQLAIIATQMVRLDQVMLPYLLIGDTTGYDLYLQLQLALGPAEAG